MEGYDPIRRLVRQLREDENERDLQKLLAEPMTLETFARLRTVAQRRWIAGNGYVPTEPLDTVIPACEVLPTPVTIPAGDWIHSTWRDGSPGEIPYKWHLFSGDLQWGVAWMRVKLDTICGMTSLDAGDHLITQPDRPDEGACRRCIAKGEAR